MKNIFFVLASLLLACSTATLNAQDKQLLKSSTEVSAQKVAVYYFHNTRRCATCEAVEEVTMSTIKKYYPKEMKSDIVQFQSLNLEEDKNTPLAKELKISGQSLLVIKDGKKIDLTNDAFMYAKSNPDKLVGIIREAIGKI